MIFEAYSIQFHKKTEQTSNGKIDFSSEIQDFKNHFHGKLNAYIQNPDDEEPEFFQNQVFRQLNDDIILLRLCNNKKVSKVINFQVQKEDTYPFTTIIFDLREDSMLLVIQRNTAFNNDTDKVRDLLQEFFKNIIDGRRGYNVTFGNRIRILDFWKFVEYRQNRHDVVKKVEFNFPNERKDKIKGDQDLIAHLRFFRSIGAALNAANEQMRYETNGCLRLEQTNEDIRRLVGLCVDNAYDITVHFKDFGVCRSTTDMRKALFPMNVESILEDFIMGQTVMRENSDIATFALALWLENVVKELEEYETDQVS